MTKTTLAMPVERLQRRIFVIRGIRVMLSSDLAELYGVETKVLNQAVRRNRERFPSDFVFQLTREEFDNLKSQIVTSSWGGARRALPYAFSEHGILMLSSVLRSARAIQVNIEIMRAFIRLRELIGTDAALSERLDDLERKYDSSIPGGVRSNSGLVESAPESSKPDRVSSKNLTASLQLCVEKC